MREGPHSGAVGPKHRLVLETALLLQCHLCISQDAWVSMETTSQRATAVRVPSPTRWGQGIIVLALPYTLCTWVGFFLAFVSWSAVLMGVLCPGWQPSPLL